MTSLIDTSVRYDLAESTCPPLRLGELGDLAPLAELSLGYGTSRGDEDLRALIAAEAGVDAEQVLVTVGAIAAMFLLAQDLCPGRVVLAAPCFPPARAVPEGLGSPIDTVRLRFDDGYRLPIDAIADALSPATRLVSIASPQNPSGVRFTDHELRDLLAAMEERAPEAVVLVDETYRESSYGDSPTPRSAAAMSPRVVTCSSLSKAHGAPGLRLGWLITTDPERYERLRNAKFLTTVACSGPDEYLATRVLRNQAALLAPRAALLRDALAELERWAAGQPVDLVRPDGGALCCLRLHPDHDVPAFYARLSERDTRVAPGSWFGEDDHVFRVGFGHLGAPDFTEALARLADALAG
jgi:aspartate/methionine/tyrosine aminotransferase